MANMTLRDEQQIMDFLRGCGVLATGGGGEPARGLQHIRSFAREGGQVSWIDLDEVPDEAWTVSAWGMGSIAPQSPAEQAQRDALGLTADSFRYNADRAIRELEKFAGVKIECLVPVELGGENTAGPMIAALQLGLPVIDGDYTGRSAPELAQGTPLVLGHFPMPLSSVDGWGNTCLLKTASSVTMAERMGKFLSLASLSTVFMAGYLLQAKDVRHCLIRGTLSRAYEVGRSIREARERNRSPIQAALDTAGGFLLFLGRVAKKEWEDRDGYMYGSIHIAGAGPYAGHRARIWLKNENHVFWVDEQPRVTTPDLISVVDATTGEPYTNTTLAEGAHVAVLGFPAPEIWRSTEGLRWIGPSFFGFPLEYVPIEQRYTAQALRGA